MSHRNPGLQNTGCGGGCCNDCLYLCFVDSVCQTQAWGYLKLCSTDGQNYSGSDPQTGASATATIDPTNGWTVSYSCPGGGNTHSFGAGNSLPQAYEAQSGWYVSLSHTPIACVGSGLSIDCFNCIITNQSINRTVFATLTGWNVGGVSFDGTYALAGPSPTYDYLGPEVAADPSVCTMCASSVYTCYLQLSIHLQCAQNNHLQSQYDWSVSVQSPGASNPCYPAGSWPYNCITQCAKLNLAAKTIDYSANFGACNFNLDAGLGVTFHF